jgi:hypothetical protein
MKSLILILTAMVLLPLAKPADMKNEDQLIDERLQLRFEFPPQWRGTEVSAPQIIAESDAGWVRYLQLFRENLAKNGLGARDDLIASKDRIRETWLRQRAVLLRHLDVKGAKAFRFDGGRNEPCGYVVYRDGKPFRLLTLRISRPDPNIGNVELPFP